MASNVVVFVSIFLGIVTGPQTIEVAVSDEVAAVEIRVDGEMVRKLHEPPWQISHDFGPELTTRKLEAVALDRSGRELSRASQLLNVPRGRIEAEILFEAWVDRSPTVARIVWHSAEALEPLRTAVTLDGALLQASDLDRIELPALDPDRLHFLAVEMVFENRQIATAEVVFGGAYGTAIETELTAVPLQVGLRRLRSPEAARGWLRTADGSELPVVVVDEAGAEVMIVREDAAVYYLAALDLRMRRARDFNYKRLRVGRSDNLRFVSARPSSRAHPDMRYEVFPISRAYGPHEGVLPALLAGIVFTEEVTSAEKITDAVAIAGRFAVESQKRRAVVLVTTDCSAISGQSDPQQVRDYLKELHVPLRVWQVGPVRGERKDQGLCELAEEIQSLKKYGAAVRRLKNTLARQQVVWVRGAPLPREIEIAAAPRNVSLAGQ